MSIKVIKDTKYMVENLWQVVEVVTADAAVCRPEGDDLRGGVGVRRADPFTNHLQVLGPMETGLFRIGV